MIYVYHRSAPDAPALPALTFDAVAIQLLIDARDAPLAPTDVACVDLVADAFAAMIASPSRTVTIDDPISDHVIAMTTNDGTVYLVTDYDAESATVEFAAYVDP